MFCHSAIVLQFYMLERGSWNSDIPTGAAYHRCLFSDFRCQSTTSRQSHWRFGIYFLPSSHLTNVNDKKTNTPSPLTKRSSINENYLVKTLMKTRCCCNTQLFAFQLLLFWWAYCSLFPWHPAAILQLLIFTNRNPEGKKTGPSFCFPFIFSPENFGGTRLRNSRYHSSDQNDPKVCQSAALIL